MSYIGNELDDFAQATNWRDYWCDAVRGFLGRQVLEVGAGIGSATWALYGRNVDRWVALEPDPLLADRLRSEALQRGAEVVEAVCGTIDAVSKAQKFDSVLYIDVLEHIDDDAAELLKACDRLKTGGHLIVLAPAHQFLFSPFDRAIGHFRRYDKARLRHVRPESCREVVMRYLDCVGLCASLGNRLVLRSHAPTRSQVSFWDSRMVPLSRVIDPLLVHSIGKSILAVWRKD